MSYKRFSTGVCSFLLMGMMMSIMTAALYSQEWTGWKGPNHDGKSTETGLLNSWPKEGPPLLWKCDSLGEGYSNLAFWKDMIFTEGDIKGETHLFILNRADGKLLRKIQVGTGGDIGGYPGPRSTPCTDGERVYTLNHFGILTCIEIATGKIVWSKKYESDFEGAMMLSKILKLHWGFSESPLLDGNRLICSPGGKKGTFAALTS
ncbi:MAG: PQQ-binding-like beta-propeller repeat protein [Planctomycetia bacterium]|nr:PQQ-binding-like beta-propeller repeat protein [Planctomycetia bacterium]